MKYKIYAWTPIPTDEEVDDKTLYARTTVGLNLKLLYCQLFYDYVKITEV